MNNVTLVSNFDYSKASPEVIESAQNLNEDKRVEQIDGSNFVVKGGSQYEVVFDRNAKTIVCTCKGCENYGYCKHSIAVRNYIVNDENYDDSAPVLRVTDDDLKKTKVKKFVVTQEMKDRIALQTKKQDDRVVAIHQSIPVLEINYDMYLPVPFGDYVQIGDEMETLTKAIDAGLPFLIEGDKGIGKTLLVNTVCCKENIANVSYSCSSGTTMGDILGREHLLGNDSVFELGLLPTAIEVANHFGKGILYLDELNALEPEIQKMLNPVIDARRSITVNGHIYRLNEGVKFSIVATMNPSTYAGTSPLNEDLRSRFIGEMWKYPSGKHLTQICQWADVPKGVQKNILQLAMDTLGMKQRGEITYVLSTRDIEMFTRVWRAWMETGLKGDPLIIKTIITAVLIKFGDAEDRATVRQRAEEIFAIGLPLD